MDPQFIIYIFLLFLLFNKNPYFSLHISHKQPLFSALMNAFSIYDGGFYYTWLCSTYNRVNDYV